ncbi:MAG: glycosyltransferase family 4 protein [Acidobacteria bacterium]|nr:glycosyltransferase family 4 protein [Acidobacteriota bacterium]
MTIVVTADFAFVNGGAARIALDSARGLAAHGHDVVLFTAVGPVADDLRDVPHLRTICLDQQDVWTDPNRVRAATHGLWNHTAAERMDALLATLDPAATVVHLHSWTKALSTSVVRAAHRRGFRVVTTLHDFLTVCPTGTLFNHATGQCCALTPMSPACMRTNCDAHSYAHKVWRVVRHMVQARVGGLPAPASDFIAISETTKEKLRELLPRRSRLHHVRNFTEMPRHAAVNVARNDAVVYVGRLSAEKGPLLLAECLHRTGARGVFVGDGPLADAVRERCPSATITGWLSPEDVRTQLEHARMLVLPSLWFEAQGLVVAEAAAMGVPSIVPDSSGARDWVIDDVDGVWFRGGDADDLSRQITRLLEDDAGVARLGRAAYDKFWAVPPTLERHVQDLEGVYGTMLRRATA